MTGNWWDILFCCLFERDRSRAGV